jgi:hypothetical protein
MVILPGSKYLIASVREEQRESYAIMIVALDYRGGGSLPLAKLTTPSKVYNLQTKFTSYQGQMRIMVSYINRDAKSKKNRTGRWRAHLPSTSISRCTTVFTTLGATDQLSDPDILHPVSETYNAFVMG